MPEALHHERDRALSFGRVAELYDAVRPGYPDAAVDHILAAAEPCRTVVEVGCGTGKATALLAARGLAVTAVEPSPEMAAVAARNAPDATVTASAFEDYEGPPHAADLVVAAQSWHWVDPAVGVPKAAGLLRPGGVLAVMANVARDGGVDLRAELTPAFESVFPGLIDTTGFLNWPGDVEPFDPALFEALEPWHLDWDQAMDADAFVGLMRSHSEYPLLPPADADRLAEAVHAAIDAAGGAVTLRYRTKVTLGRTPA